MILAIQAGPTSDFQLIADIVISCMGMLTAATGLYAAVTAYRTRSQLQEVHLQINSRMDALIETTRALGVAEGSAAESKTNGHTLSPTIHKE